MLGAGGHAKVVIATVRATGGEVAAVLDDDPNIFGTRVLGLSVEGPISTAVTFGLPCVAAIGDNGGRRSVVKSLQVIWATLVHPTAVLDESVGLGEGTVVFAGAVLQPDARVGRHAIVNTSASIDHDCVLADFCQVAPGAHLGGNVALGIGAFVGIGACVHQGSRLESGAVLGGGGFLTRGKTIPPGETWIGVPARPMAPR